MNFRPNAIPPLTDWKKGDKILAGHLQQPVEALRQLIQGMTTAPAGEQPPQREMWLGLVVAKGPKGELLSDIQATPEQYWVQKQNVNGDAPRAKLAFAEDSSDQLADPSAPDIFLVNNLSDWLNGTHTIQVGQPVAVFAWWDNGSTNTGTSGQSSSNPFQSNKRFFMWAAGLPNGQFQYSVYQMVSQNQQGFDWVRSHPLL